MKLLIIITSFIIVQAEARQCHGVRFDGNCYTEEVLRTGIPSGLNLAVDSTHNTVYYSYNSTCGVAVVNIKTREHEELYGCIEGFALAIHPRTHEVYVGSNNGIYRYNPHYKTVLYFGAYGSEIQHLGFHKNTLYYSNYRDKHLYTNSGAYSTIYKDLENSEVIDFVFDHCGDIVFYNDTGLYSFNMESKYMISYNFKPVYSCSLATDGYGVVYYACREGVYALNRVTRTLRKVFYGFCLALGFHNGNLVYTDWDRLVILKPEE